MTAVAEAVEVEHLSEAERSAILDVLQRNEAVRQQELERIKALKESVKVLRMNGVLKEHHVETKTCSRCRDSFGWLVNKGAYCPNCQQKVCRKCRRYGQTRSQWICVVCMKQMEVEAMSGRWFYSRYPKSLRDRVTNEIVYASDLVRSAIMRAAAAAARAGQSPASSPSSPITPPPTALGREFAKESLRAGSFAKSSEELRDSLPEMRSTTLGSSSSQRSHTLAAGPSQSLGSRLNVFSRSRESLTSYYSNAGEGNYGRITVSGEIQFGLTYNHKSGSLELLIGRCRNIAAVNAAKRTSRPYVKVYLLPDKSKSGKRKTRVKKDTLNPVFDELLEFKITHGELSGRTLCVMVWNSDHFGRNYFLGEVNLSLNTPGLLNDQTPKWFTLQDRAPTLAPPGGSLAPPDPAAASGQLDVGLKYVSAEELSARRKTVVLGGEVQVLVKGARNLAALLKQGDVADSFCRAYLFPEKKATRSAVTSRSAVQKSSVVKRNNDPRWDHTFVFESLAPERLHESSVELTVWDHELVSNTFLGGVRLNLGTGTSDGLEVSWMYARDEEAALWRAMIDRPNTWIEGTLILRTQMTRPT